MHSLIWVNVSKVTEHVMSPFTVHHWGGQLAPFDLERNLLSEHPDWPIDSNRHITGRSMWISACFLSLVRRKSIFPGNSHNCGSEFCWFIYEAGAWSSAVIWLCWRVYLVAAVKPCWRCFCQTGNQSTEAAWDGGVLPVPWFLQVVHSFPLAYLGFSNQYFCCVGAPLKAYLILQPRHYQVHISHSNLWRQWKVTM